MNTIVLATDGSPAARAATAEAIRLAGELDGRLVIVGIEHVAVPAYGYYGYGVIYLELLKGEHAHVHRVLTDAAHIADDAGLDCETIARTGDVVETICEIAEANDARFVVVGSHGWNALRRAVFGSVSAGLLHSAPCPVLVVRAGAEVHEYPHVHAEAAVV
jgi:nucleotide-binding universal stress UspA family protein